MEKKKKMSLVEKAGLFFGIVGVFADFAALVSFTYGFASLDQFTPEHISISSATSFFKWFSGLVIIYGWFISSWYLTRRTFVYRYEKPRGYKNPLNSRSSRTIFGVGLFLIPTFIYWSIVNVTFSVSVVRNDAPQVFETPSVTFTPQAPELLLTATPEIISTSTTEVGLTTETSTASSSELLITSTATPIPARTATPEEIENVSSFMFGFTYYLLIFPFVLFFFGLIIYASINSLMPIVHVELLDDYE